MRVRFLGTGTSLGVPEIRCSCTVCTSDSKFDKRLRSSVLVETEEKAILIDAGPDLRQQMLRESITSLDGVLITHEHYDHVGGLDDLRLYTREKPLPVFGLGRVMNTICDRMPYAFTEKRYPGAPDFILNEIDGHSFRIGEIEIQPVNVMHYKLHILGYRIFNFAYLTDVKEIPEEEFSKLQGLDVLVINALRKKEHLAHQNLEQALMNIARIAPRKAYLTHFSHDMGLHAEVEKELPSDVSLAYDGLTISF
ncbi:MAG: MBL fold metallo-hydrolase [Bacteroidales bacterium]|nr:MBL fold metallo-hydrolase [Bacteroidales bacterium]